MVVSECRQDWTCVFIIFPSSYFQEELGVNDEEEEPIFTTEETQQSTDGVEHESPGEQRVGEDFDRLVGGEEDKNWTPFGLAAFAVGGIGLVYSSMKT